VFGPVLAVLGFGSDDDEGREITKIVIEEYTRECPAPPHPALSPPMG
jgi:hypothetical protein